MRQSSTAGTHDNLRIFCTDHRRRLRSSAPITNGGNSGFVLLHRSSTAAFFFCTNHHRRLTSPLLDNSGFLQLRFNSVTPQRLRNLCRSSTAAFFSGLHRSGLPSPDFIAPDFFLRLCVAPQHRHSSTPLLHKDSSLLPVTDDEQLSTSALRQAASDFSGSA